VTSWLAIAWAVCIGVAIAWALWLVRLSTSRREGFKAGEDTGVRKMGAAGTRNVKPGVFAEMQAVAEPFPRRKADTSTRERRPPRPKPSVPAGDQVDKLKQKAAVGAPWTIASEHEVAVLKAKLGATPTAASRKDGRTQQRQAST
jgi:hypothetical protein